MAVKTFRADRAVHIQEPVVLIPVSDYEELLIEAGYKRTPKLDKEIAQARRRFKKGKYISWNKIKDDIG